MPNALMITDGRKPVTLTDRGLDILKADEINRIPGPFMVRLCGSDWWWEVIDVEVETALCRINVSGLADVKCFSEVMDIKDIEGNHHDPESLWRDGPT